MGVSLLGWRGNHQATHRGFHEYLGEYAKTSRRQGVLGRRRPLACGHRNILSGGRRSCINVNRKTMTGTLVTVYHSLQVLVEGRTNTVEMPSIQGKSIASLEALMLRVDTSEEGGRPVHISCYLFLRILGHCAGFSYGELMLGAHAHLKKAPWAVVVYVEFQSHRDNFFTKGSHLCS